LDVNYRARRAGPLWEGRRVIAEGGVVNFMDKDTEEGGGLVVRVRLELGVDVNDKRGGHRREQTGLLPKLAPPHLSSDGTHEDQGGVQILVILLHESPIVLLGLLAVVFIESSPVILLSEW
jgi:hypothetical protein